MEKKVLGIIPARGGSKGVIRKNIRLVGGQPLIAYTIKAARASQMLTDYIVSTDDSEIAEFARSMDCAVIMRPAELATDETPMVPVVEHILSSLKTRKSSYDYVCLLQPTTPLRTAHDINEALGILMKTGADSVVSVYQVEDHHPSRMYTLKHGILVPYTEEPSERLRQKLQAVYHRNGAVYACRCELITESKTLIGKNPCPYIMPRNRSINIDDELDLAFADFILRQKNS